MKSSSGFVEYVIDQLSSLDNISYKRMFGGYGIYYNGVICAMIAEDTLYIKVGPHNKSDYEQAGSEPFSYINGKGNRVQMSYWEVPLFVLEDPEILAIWVRKSVGV